MIWGMDITWKRVPPADPWTLLFHEARLDDGAGYRLVVTRQGAGDWMWEIWADDFPATSVDGEFCKTVTEGKRGAEQAARLQAEDDERRAAS